MLNFCDSEKYYTDKNLENKAKRNPRSNEDVEIPTIIKNNESLNMAQAQSCGLNKISALTIKFDDRLRILDITGGDTLLPGNPRKPTGVALSGYSQIRKDHDWYTIGDKYGINDLQTNGSVDLSIIGFNNQSIICNNLNLIGSCYANGLINCGKLEIKNNSRMYNTFIGTATGVFIESLSKVDSLNISTPTILKLGSSSSIADSDISCVSLVSLSTKIIDTKISCGIAYLSNTTIAGEISSNKVLADKYDEELYSIMRTEGADIVRPYNPNITVYANDWQRYAGGPPEITFGPGNIIRYGATVSAPRVDIKRNVSVSGILESTQAIRVLNGISIQKSGVLTVNNILPNFSGITINSGIMSCEETIGPGLFTNNGGIINFGTGNFMNNKIICNSGIINISNNLHLNSGNINDTIINGNNLIVLDAITINNKSQALNNLVFFSGGQSINNGIINNLYCLNGINNGTGIKAELIYGTSANNQNATIIDCVFRSGAINSGIVMSASFYDNSISEPTSSGGYIKIFDSVRHDGKADVLEIYDSGSTKGFGKTAIVNNFGILNTGLESYWDTITVYNNGINYVPGIKISGSFYDTSKCHAASGTGLKPFYSGCDLSFFDASRLSINNSGEINAFRLFFYDNSLSDNIIISGCYFEYHNSSLASGTTIADSSGSFHQYSIASGNIDYAEFYDNSIQKSFLYSGVFYGNSINEKDVHSAIFNDNSYNASGGVLASGGSGIFYDRSYNLGDIKNIAYFIGEKTYNGGLLPSGEPTMTCSELYFSDGATNKRKISDTDKISFINKSINSESLESNTNIFFQNNAINFSDIKNTESLNFRFGSESHSDGYLYITGVGMTGNPKLTNNIAIIFSGNSINKTYISNTQNLTFIDGSINNVVYIDQDNNSLVSVIADNISFMSGSINNCQVECSNLSFSVNSNNNSYLKIDNTNISFISGSNNSSLIEAKSCSVAFSSYSINYGTLNSDSSSSNSFTDYSQNIGVCSGNTTFIDDSINQGTTNTDSEHTSTSFINKSINNGVVNQYAVFATVSFADASMNSGILYSEDDNSSSNFSSSSANDGIIYGNATFIDDSINRGTINNGSGTSSSSFTNRSMNIGSIYNLSNFTNESVNKGKIFNNCEFSVHSENEGTINGDASFNNDSINKGTINGNVNFVDGSVNEKIIIGNTSFIESVNNQEGTIDGNANFNESSVNNGTINGNTIFDEYSVNNGTINGNASFTNYSRHNGQIYGSATFDETSINDGEVYPAN